MRENKRFAKLYIGQKYHVGGVCMSYYSKNSVKRKFRRPGTSDRLFNIGQLKIHASIKIIYTWLLFPANMTLRKHRITQSCVTLQLHKKVLNNVNVLAVF